MVGEKNLYGFLHCSKLFSLSYLHVLRFCPAPVRPVVELPVAAAGELEARMSS